LNLKGKIFLKELSNDQRLLLYPLTSLDLSLKKKRAKFFQYLIFFLITSLGEKGVLDKRIEASGISSKELISRLILNVSLILVLNSSFNISNFIFNRFPKGNRSDWFLKPV
jgi:hypothetical protein